MRTRVKKWGNSLAVRIPKAFSSEVHLEENSIVEVTASDGKIVIKPIPPRRWSLEQLLEGITEDNIHGEIKTGEAVGNEVW